MFNDVSGPFQNKTRQDNCQELPVVPPGRSTCPQAPVFADRYYLKDSHNKVGWPQLVTYLNTKKITRVYSYSNKKRKKKNTLKGHTGQRMRRDIMYLHYVTTMFIESFVLPSRKLRNDKVH